MREFDGRDPDGGSDDFGRWLMAHPQGYYVNVTSPRVGRLHRATCHHIYPPSGRLNLVASPKWASESRRELEDKARARAVELAPCPDCDH